MSCAIPHTTPCSPKHPVSDCETCARFNPLLPVLPECRPRVPVIDATVLRWPDGICPLHVGTPTREIVRRLSGNKTARVQVAA